jgi:hypothetical protein
MAQIAMIALAAAGSGYSAWQAKEAKDEQTAAIAKSNQIQQKNLQDKKRKVLAMQRASLAASGIDLHSGLVDVLRDDTITASQEEANLIADYYETQISSVKSQTRATYASAIGSFASKSISQGSAMKRNSMYIG